MKKSIKQLETPTSVLMKKRALKEFLIGSVIVLFLIFLSSASEVELVESIYDFTRTHEHWELDELLFGFLWLAIVATVYGIRRLQDIKTLNNEITHSAYYDFLTALPNRNLALNYLKTKIEDAQLAPGQFAIMFLDFDNFKEVNDSHGHDSGDQLIRLVSKRLSLCVKEEELLARLGGDEFLMIVAMPEVENDFTAFIQRIQQCQNEAFEIDGKSISTNFSIGIAVYPRDGKNSQELLIAADTAMYQAKRNGTGNACFYMEEFGNEMYERQQLSAQLRKELKNNKLFLEYQPIVESKLGLVQGYEALLRWKYKGRMINPELIIDLGEESGLSHDINNWVMETAFEESRQLLSDDQFLAINVSVTQFLYPLFVPNIKKLIQQCHFDPSRLEIEITESSILSNFAESSIIINKLKEMGVKIAIDDFGTGYSSLSRLKNLHVDRLKIDRSFLVDALVENRSSGIYRAIVGLANNLDIDIVAEGIETKDHVNFLSDFSPLLMQGFFFQKPARVEEQSYMQSMDIETSIPASKR